MKAIIELNRAITDDQIFYNKQFAGALPSKDNPDLTNILFLNPQLSGKHLYKMFLPYFALAGNPKIKTAIQHISKFGNEAQWIGGKETQLTDEQITWASIIVFPFTSQPLVSEIYKRIRLINPYAKIIYQVDFNYYELSPKHLAYPIFTDPFILSEVENNAFYADVILTSNIELSRYLHEKFSDMVLVGKYKGKNSNVKIACQPLFVSEQLMLENIDYNPEALFKVTAKEIAVVPPIENPPALTQKLAEITGANKNLTDKHEVQKTMKQEKVRRQRVEEKAKPKKVASSKKTDLKYTIIKAKSKKK